ncbi:MAG: AAC(3) family N-acetyltransferase [Candidatus Heimdallarchaeota archaeon]|nr:AAC(3) family N-acetyltransferase [Candidatus Heimdallarchaeota archaeon]
MLSKDFFSGEHGLTPCFGKNSPFEQLYKHNGKILLLGVDHQNNTSLHYAEWKANIKNKPMQKQGAAFFENARYETWSNLPEAV